MAVDFDEIFWRQYLTVTCTGLLMTWLAGGRALRKGDREPNVMRYPARAKYGNLVLSVIVFVGSGSLLFLEQVRQSKTALCIVLAAHFLCLAGVMYPISQFRTRYVLMPKGIIYTVGFRRTKTVAWSDIQRVSRYHHTSMFVLWTWHGEKVCVDWSLAGLQPFSKMVLDKVPDHAIDSEAGIVLREAAAGILPEVVPSVYRNSAGV